MRPPAMNYDRVVQRYPRLVGRLMIACNLSLGEATACIQCRQNRADYGGEAVSHAGGILMCLRHAVRVRGLARREVIRALVHAS